MRKQVPRCHEVRVSHSITRGAHEAWESQMMYCGGWHGGGQRKQMTPCKGCLSKAWETLLCMFEIRKIFFWNMPESHQTQGTIASKLLLWVATSCFRRWLRRWLGPEQNNKEEKRMNNHFPRIVPGLSEDYPGTVPAFSWDFLGISFMCFRFRPGTAKLRNCQGGGWSIESADMRSVTHLFALDPGKAWGCEKDLAAFQLATCAMFARAHKQPWSLGCTMRVFVWSVQQVYLPSLLAGALNQNTMAAIWRNRNLRQRTHWRNMISLICGYDL